MPPKYLSEQVFSSILCRGDLTQLSPWLASIPQRKLPLRSLVSSEDSSSHELSSSEGPQEPRPSLPCSSSRSSGWAGGAGGDEATFQAGPSQQTLTEPQLCARQPVEQQGFRGHSDLAPAPEDTDLYVGERWGHVSSSALSPGPWHAGRLPPALT